MVLARILRAVHNCGKFAKTAHLCIRDAQDGNHDDGFSFYNQTSIIAPSIKAAPSTVPSPQEPAAAAKSPP
ncbi:hypothetical protein BFW01_g1739 [Lasiodiplodia theobromae]|nr:hypothetical protein BFW01_g1739 [Lasiodiplodia theobromae]